MCRFVSFAFFLFFVSFVNSPDPLCAKYLLPYNYNFIFLIDQTQNIRHKMHKIFPLQAKFTPIVNSFTRNFSPNARFFHSQLMYFFRKHFNKCFNYKKCSKENDFIELDRIG